MVGVNHSGHSIPGAYVISIFLTGDEFEAVIRVRTVQVDQY